MIYVVSLTARWAEHHIEHIEHNPECPTVTGGVE